MCTKLNFNLLSKIKEMNRKYMQPNILFESKSYKYIFLVQPSLKICQCKHSYKPQLEFMCCTCTMNAKQKHLGCKKSARPIRSHNGYISDQKL